MIFRNIVFSALAVGLITGILYGVFQQARISPIIHAAERYEAVGPEAGHSHGEEGEAAHAHEPWAPADGAQRTLFTIGANVLTGFAFAIFLISLMALHNQKSDKPPVNAVTGAGWGVAVLLAVFVAPAMFGLHPEVPGTEAAALEARQAWWLFSAIATGTGIAVLYYAPLKFKVTGAVLIVLPHVFGAPQPEGGLSFANTDPEAVAALTELSHRFFWMTAAGMVMFCLLLGVLSGFMTRRFVKLDSGA